MGSGRVSDAAMHLKSDMSAPMRQRRAGRGGIITEEPSWLGRATQPGVVYRDLLDNGDARNSDRRIARKSCRWIGKFCDAAAENGGVLDGHRAAGGHERTYRV